MYSSFVLMRYSWNFDGSDAHLNALRMPPLAVPSTVDLNTSLYL
jgi:hypothetical protein